MDLERDLFRVTFRPDARPNPDPLLQAISDLGYKPTIERNASFQPTDPKVHPAAGVPELLRKPLEKARAEGKLVLVDCMAEW